MTCVIVRIGGLSLGQTQPVPTSCPDRLDTNHRLFFHHPHTLGTEWHPRDRREGWPACEERKKRNEELRIAEMKRWEEAAKRQEECEEEAKRHEEMVAARAKWKNRQPLNRKSALAWQTASPEDKLETCEDFVCRTWISAGLDAYTAR